MIMNEDNFEKLNNSEDIDREVRNEVTESDNDVKQYNIGDTIDFKALMDAEDDRFSDTRPLYKAEELDQYREDYEFRTSYQKLYEREKDPFTKEHDRNRFRELMLNALFGFLGMSLAIGLLVYVLPNTRFFRNSPMSDYISQMSNNAAYDAASSVMKNVSGKLSDIENQKAIISESGKTKDLEVSDIVSQYKSAVVTVITKLYSNPDRKQDGYRTFIGTGFVLNSDGLIATNHHVIVGADELTCLMSNGDEVIASVVNTDEASDLAIIKLQDKNLVDGVVTIGDSDTVKVGDRVVAIGNPVSRRFAGTVTSGIISGKNRVVEIGGTAINYLQTDAAINEGNSGGPLFNMRGEVIGINTAKIRSNDTEGISFAIPIKTLKEKLAILSTPPVYMGLTSRDMEPESLKKLNIKNGVAVIELREGYPAERAGVMVGDVIMKFNSIPVYSTSQMNELKGNLKVGDKVTLTIQRGKAVHEITLKLVTVP